MAMVRKAGFGAACIGACRLLFWLLLIGGGVSAVFIIIFPKGALRPGWRGRQTSYVLNYVSRTMKLYEEGALSPCPPPPTAGLGALENWMRLVGGLSPEEGLVDGWHRPLVYGVDNRGPFGFYLYSAGPNGVDEKGVGDDIVRDELSPGRVGRRLNGDLRYRPDLPIKRQG